MINLMLMVMGCRRQNESIFIKIPILLDILMNSTGKHVKFTSADGQLVLISRF